MTELQLENYNKMHAALKKISTGYFPAETLKKISEEEYGLEPLEALERAYENIREEAKAAIKGVRSLSRYI